MARVTPDTEDTIVAIATASGAGRRGVVRLSGPKSLAIAGALCDRPIESAGPRRLTHCRVRVLLAGRERSLHADLLVWPDTRSYTHQPSVEVHTVGSPPLLAAVVNACLATGARLAEPGEFTLRAFLAGRLDLTQAEAVLGVIDADDEDHLEEALNQLAGGLSTPLHRLRVDLLNLLADLEAGLDFVEEEDVRFVEPAELRRRLADAASLVAATEEQVAGRDAADRLPRVAIVGPPNVGKSRLFNALTARFGVDQTTAEALVADMAGVTRDTLAATVEYKGQRFRLLDTAGDNDDAAVDAIDHAARGRLAAVQREADLLLLCQPAIQCQSPPTEAPRTVAVATMADRVDASTLEGWLVTSAKEGRGLGELAETINARLDIETHSTTALSSTAERCTASLAAARSALERASDSAAADAGDELVSFELREALDGLGRVVGEVVTDEVLGEIFGKFCIGK